MLVIGTSLFPTIPSQTFIPTTNEAEVRETSTSYFEQHQKSLILEISIVIGEKDKKDNPVATDLKGIKEDGRVRKRGNTVRNLKKCGEGSVCLAE